MKRFISAVMVLALAACAPAVYAQTAVGNNERIASAAFWIGGIAAIGLVMHVRGHKHHKHRKKKPETASLLWLPGGAPRLQLLGGEGEYAFGAGYRVTPALSVSIGRPERMPGAFSAGMEWRF